MNYKIKIASDSGNNQVEVLKKSDENSYQLEWTFTLKKDSEPIVLAEMYNDDCFVIVNWDAWLRVYSISKKELLFEKQFNGKISSSAALSKNNTHLYVAYNCDDENYLDIVSLSDFSIQKSISLPEGLNTRYLALGPGETILFYTSEVETGEKASHGYFKVDPASEKTTYTQMEHPQLDEFETQAPVISLAHSLGAMPLWDVEVKKDSNGEPLFIMKVMLFDLKSFKTKKIIPVREFSVNELNSYESTSEEMSELFIKRKSAASSGLLSKLFKKKSDEDEDDEEEYYESMVEFISDNLYSIYFTDDDSFWVSFRGGMVRKVGFDASRSPLFKTVALPDFTKEQMETPEEFLTTFHSCIDSIVNNKVILKEDNKYYQMKIDKEELHSKESVIEKTLTSVDEDNVEMSDADQLQLKEKDSILIKVKDIKSEKSVLDALEQMIQLTKDIDEIRSGHLLIFKVSDGSSSLSEEEFFKKAVKMKSASEKIGKIIENFISYKKADQLYIDDETTAMAHAVYFLTEADPVHIDTAITYLSVIDAEHDVFNREKLLPMLFEKYSDTHGSYLREELSKLDDGELWLEGYEE